MMEMFAVHEMAVALDLIKSAMDVLIVFLEKMNKIVVQVYKHIAIICLCTSNYIVSI